LDLEERNTDMKNTLSDETGQDLVEYSLLLAFIALAGAAALIGIGGNIAGLWSAANNHMANAGN
jgi:Flp pilus assembly pilin Flp